MSLKMKGYNIIRKATQISILDKEIQDVLN